MGCTFNGKMLKKKPVTIHRTADVNTPFGTDKSVPYEKNQHFPIQHPVKFQFIKIQGKNL